MMMKYLIYILFGFTLVSCNQSKIDELEKEVQTLKTENNALKNQISEMQDVIIQYENYVNAQCNYSAQIQAQQQQRNFHQQNAQQHLRDAEFWRQNGNEFLYESHMRNAQQELNNLP